MPVKIHDPPRLLLALVDREDDKPVLCLTVGRVGVGGCDKDRHRAFDRVLVGLELAGLGIAAGGGDGEALRALQGADSIHGLRHATLPLRSRARGDVRLSVILVEKRLSGEARILYKRFIGHKRARRVLEPRLAGPAARENEHPGRCRRGSRRCTCGRKAR